MPSENIARADPEQEEEQEDDLELADLAPLEEILYSTGCGEFDGIKFDLRHEMLPLPHWQCARFAFSPIDTMNEAQTPWIWFPWFEEVGSAGSYNYYKHKTKLEPDERTFGESPPEFVVERGDFLFVQSVSSMQVGDSFDHPHDTEIRYATICVRKADGSCTTVFRIPYYQEQSIISGNNCDDLGSKIYQRIFTHLNIKSVEEFGSVKTDNTNVISRYTEPQCWKHV